MEWHLYTDARVLCRVRDVLRRRASYDGRVWSHSSPSSREAKCGGPGHRPLDTQVGGGGAIWGLPGRPHLCRRGILV
jgi:hypothetical protein